MAENEPEYDSDEDVEFEDAFPQAPPVQPPRPPSVHSISISLERSPWSTDCYLPDQQARPFTPGSEEEEQLRAMLSAGLDTINLRQQKAALGMTADSSRVDDNPFHSFRELCGAVERLADKLWESATTSVSVEGFLALAGIINTAMKTYDIEVQTTLNILNKFDIIFEALCTGKKPGTEESLPRLPDRPLVTQTQKVRMRSLAENTRGTVYSMLFSSSGSSDSHFFGDDRANGNGYDTSEMDETDEDLPVEDDGPDASDGPWWMEANKIYERTLMLLGGME